MVYHVPQFLQTYHYIHDIGVAQVERKNFDHRQAYFGSTNRNGSKWKKHVSKQVHTIIQIVNLLDLFHKFFCLLQ